MRVVPINEAEAVIEPFWDGGSSEHPADKRSLLCDYAVRIAAEARAVVRQTWCYVEARIESAPPGVVAVSLERPCDIAIPPYDVFRVFAAFPAWVRLGVKAEIDGREAVLLDAVAGREDRREYDGRLSGRRMTRLRIELALGEARPAGVCFSWLGLSESAAQARMEGRRSPYDAAWEGALAGDPGPAAAEIGIFFGPSDLERLRDAVRSGPAGAAFDALRAQAETDLAMDPESEVGQYVPNPDRRWVRDRDMGRADLAAPMERLAFVGLVAGDARMSRMAARMALSVSHCDTWCESVMGLFPGATWHHRSFTEEHYCRSCALVLDWAGGQFTPYGRQIVRDAIAMKGLPRIESDFKRMEYIRGMNQGIVFSSGRILGALALLPAYPRYASLVEEGERDLKEMIEEYVKADGGTLEGMGYWTFTFATAMPVFLALARRRGVPLKEVLPPGALRTAAYPLAMLSTEGDGSTYLPVNDAHSGKRIDPGLIAAYRSMTDGLEWDALWESAGRDCPKPANVFHVILPALADARQAPGNPPAAPRPLAVLPAVGQASSVREAPGIGRVLFHLCSGPTYRGHFHEDKNSFILEAAGEALAIDRGVTVYSDPDTALIGNAARHNLLYPENPGGVSLRQPPDAPGAVLGSVLDVGGVLLMASDAARAWAPGLFQAAVRRVFSPEPDLFLIDDEAAFAEERSVSFRLHSRAVMERDGDAILVRGERAALRLTALNWTPAEAGFRAEGTDCDGRPVRMARMAAAPARAHRLLTAVEVLPAGTGGRERWSFAKGDAPEARKAGRAVFYHANGCSAAEAVVREGARTVFRAVAEGISWRVG